jgi:hypothetical protein
MQPELHKRSSRQPRAVPSKLVMRVRFPSSALLHISNALRRASGAMVNVTVEARNDLENPGVVKLQGETWELNVWATTGELWKLADIEKTDWVQRRTLQVGTCAHVPVWWNEQDGTVYIVVGNDDVT